MARARANGGSNPSIKFPLFVVLTLAASGDVSRSPGTDIPLNPQFAVRDVAKELRETAAPHTFLSEA